MRSALADGGAGSAGAGGVGGLDNLAGTGGIGGNGVAGTSQGGGGGGAGVTGGAGGVGGSDAAGDAGGSAGTLAFTGGNGRTTPNGGTGSGGGGGAGASAAFVGATLPTTGLFGATGGPGGDGAGTFGGGGGGGAGGIGAIITGSGNLGVINFAIVGGIGGGGGQGLVGGSAGSGGSALIFANGGTATSFSIASGIVVDGGPGQKGGFNNGGGFAAGSRGGDGIVGSNLTIANAGAVFGGGSIGPNGASGPGGVAIVGSNLTILNSGGIFGGAGIGGTTDAIDFTGGSNRLTTAGSGAINSTVGITGALTLAQTAGAGATGSAFYSNVFAGSGSLTVTADPGNTVTLSAANTYTGATNVNGGRLEVDGSIEHSSLTTVNPNGLLTGIGTVGNTTINAGGTFAPGNGTPGTSMTISGNLAFQSGAQYFVMLNPTTSSFASMTGTATLGGATVNAIYASGSYISKQYTILTASGGVSGTFGSLVNTDLPSNFSTSLSYDLTHAFLNLTLNFGIPGGLNVNQQNVGNALTNFFTANGTIPMVYGTLSPGALSQAAGETATGSQQTTFNAMTQFMGVMTDPFIDGRGGVSSSTGAAGYADEDDSASAYAAKKRTDAYTMFTKAPLAKTWEPSWSVWAAGFGGSQNTDGNAAAGSNFTASRIFGTAVGADYRFSPNTIAGFALAGGGTSFFVAGSGSGRSDLFQAGAFVRHTMGQAYISGALAYGWQDITTDRIVTIAGFDHLRAEFNANAFSGRAEGGYRFVTPWAGGVGITPYAAAQFTTFDLPAYAEQVLMGTGNFALSYASRSVTDTRSELGFRTDKSFALQDSVLTLRGRFAWAHDFDPDRSIAATFQALPGASFVVNGAAQAADSALTTVSIERKWTNGWSAAATFEGEFSNVTTSYAGKGVVRYQW